MSKLRICLAMAASVFAVSFASTSFADEPDINADDQDNPYDDTMTEEQTTTPAQPPVVTTQPAPAPAPPSQVYVVQPPAATTTTTAANYGNDGYAERSVSIRPNRPLLSTGAGIFVLSYGASAVTAAISDNDSDDKLFIPVAGPWLDLADRPDCGAGGCSNTEDFNRAMIITSGVVQGAGILIALSSLVIPEHVEERTVAKTKPEVHFLPVSFRAGAGVGAVGRF